MIIKRFDKDSFKPFDKVLVREDDGDQWVPAFFARFAYTERYTEYAVCVGDYYRPPLFKQVVPYNEETAKLAFQCDEAPLKYNFWDDDYYFDEQCREEGYEG